MSEATDSAVVEAPQKPSKMAKRYTKKFQLSTVRRILKGEPLPVVQRKLGLANGTIKRWVEKHEEQVKADTDKMRASAAIARAARAKQIKGGTANSSVVAGGGSVKQMTLGIVHEMTKERDRLNSIIDLMKDQAGKM